MLESQLQSRRDSLSALPPPFECVPSGGRGGSRIAVTGELDITSVPKLDAALRRAEEGAEVVVLDLQALEFIDSSGARLILETDRRLRRSGARLLIEGASEEVDWFFGLIGLDRLLDMAERSAHQHLEASWPRPTHRGHRPTLVRSADP